MWDRILTKSNWLIVLGSAIGMYETFAFIPTGGGARLPVYGFALAVMGLKWTLPERGDKP